MDCACVHATWWTGTALLCVLLLICTAGNGQGVPGWCNHRIRIRQQATSHLPAVPRRWAGREQAGTCQASCFGWNGSAYTYVLDGQPLASCTCHMRLRGSCTAHNCIGRQGVGLLKVCGTGQVNGPVGRACSQDHTRGTHVSARFANTTTIAVRPQQLLPSSSVAVAPRCYRSVAVESACTTETSQIAVLGHQLLSKEHVHLLTRCMVLQRRHHTSGTLLEAGGRWPSSSRRSHTLFSSNAHKWL